MPPKNSDKNISNVWIGYADSANGWCEYIPNLCIEYGPCCEQIPTFHVDIPQPELDLDWVKNFLV